MFCYLHFCSDLDPNHLHFLLRVLLLFKFKAKIMYRLLKQALKNNPIEIRQKQDSLFANQVYRLPGNQNRDDVMADTDQTMGFAPFCLSTRNRFVTPKIKPTFTDCWVWFRQQHLGQKATVCFEEFDPAQ